MGEGFAWIVLSLIWFLHCVFGLFDVLQSFFSFPLCNRRGAVAVSCVYVCKIEKYETYDMGARLLCSCGTDAGTGAEEEEEEGSVVVARQGMNERRRRPASSRETSYAPLQLCIR